MNPKSLIEILILALAVAVISLTVTKSTLFEKPRQWILERSAWIGKLVTCPYCTSHWVSFVLVALYQPKITHSPWWQLDLLVSAFAIVALAMPIAFVVHRSFQGIGTADGDEVALLRTALARARDKLIEQERQIKALSPPG